MCIIYVIFSGYDIHPRWVAAEALKCSSEKEMGEMVCHVRFNSSEGGVDGLQASSFSGLFLCKVNTEDRSALWCSLLVVSVCL